jgi:hypothetical protein
MSLTYLVWEYPEGVRHEMAERKDVEADKITYGHASFENGRKQGAAEAAQAVSQWLNGPGGVGDKTLREILKQFESRGAAEPWCTCGTSQLSIHDPGCAFYKEPKCTCGEVPWNNGHASWCPCYKPPEKKLFECSNGHQEWYSSQPKKCPICKYPMDEVDPEEFDNDEKRRVEGDGYSPPKPPERKPLEKIGMYSLDWVSKFNAIVDRVNELSK